MKTQKGFAIVPILLILLLITAVGFTGYYVWDTQNNKKPDSSASVAGETKTSPTPIASPTTVASPTPTLSAQKFLTVKEWGVKIDGIDSEKVGYKFDGEYLRFIIPNNIIVSDECRDLGIGYSRATDKNNLISPENAQKVGAYYYLFGGGPGACGQPGQRDAELKRETVQYINNNYSNFKLELL